MKVVINKLNFDKCQMFIEHLEHFRIRLSNGKPIMEQFRFMPGENGTVKS